MNKLLVALFMLLAVLIATAQANDASQTADMYHALGLQCRCDAYDCQCKKDCLCRIVDAKPSSFLETDATVTQTAPEQSPASAAPSFFESEANAATRARVEPALFKCGCDFGGADVAMGASQSLDCDCSIAKCECTKKCACTDNAGGQVAFVETESRTVRMED